MTILNILDILKKYTDENHRISATQIGELLKKEYSQQVDRKTIKSNLTNLIDYGYQIGYTETLRKKNNGEDEIIYSDWYLERDFTDAELRLLIDSLLFSKHIPHRQCQDLIAKLVSLSNSYFKPRVKYIHTIPESLLENRSLFLNIEILDEAITNKKRVQFNYISDYDIDKKPILHKNKNGTAKVYKVNPYQMAATNARYYLICSHKYYPQTVSNYRIDRIVNIKLLDEPITSANEVPAFKNSFNLPKHMAENIYMFGGESVWVKFRAKRYLIKDILDWFGCDVKLSEISNDDNTDDIIADIKVNAQAMVYWALQYGEHIDVFTPIELRQRIGSAAKIIAEKYGER